MTTSRLLTTSATVTALLATTVAPTAAAKATSPGKHTVVAEKAYVTTQAGKGWSGTLVKGQTFKVTRLSKTGKYAYGLAYGKLNRGGWIEAAALSRATSVKAAAAAAKIALRGAPTLRVIDDRQAQLRFATSRRLPRTSSGVAQIRIRFAGGQRVSNVVAAGRHGSDFVYTAHVRSESDLRVGTKYTVRFTVAGQDTVVRRVKLHDAKS